MRALVTGAAGFLGSHISEHLRDRGYDVVGVDNMLGGDYANVVNGIEFHQGDCCDVEYMRGTLRGVELAYHCAAAPHEGLSLFSPTLITQHTYLSTVAVTAAAAAVGSVRRIVFTSSAARYGREAWELEWVLPKPVDPYGQAKVAAERTLEMLCQVHGMEYVIAVPHNIIGPRQKYDDPYRNVVSIMINLMLQGRQPVIYGDGEQTRSFTFVDDCVQPMLEMGVNPHASGEIFNVGPTNEGISINELAHRLAKLLGITVEPIYVAERPNEVRHVHPPSHKAQNWFGYTPATTLDQGLQQMVDWICERGPKPFQYHLPIEIDTDLVPKTWRERMF